jgi:hypothetical protein
LTIEEDGSSYRTSDFASSFLEIALNESIDNLSISIQSLMNHD